MKVTDVDVPLDCIGEALMEAEYDGDLTPSYPLPLPLPRDLRPGYPTEEVLGLDDVVVSLLLLFLLPLLLLLPLPSVFFEGKGGLGGGSG